MKYFLLLALALCYQTTFSQSEFITTWELSNNSRHINIPIKDGETYNYTVDWGDGTTTTNHTDSANHIYSSQGTYTLKITGLFPQIFFESNFLESRKIISVDQWGDNMWKSMENAFYLCSKLKILATDSPNLSNVENMSGMFFECEIFNEDISSWDVSNIKNMSNMFAGCRAFNQDIIRIWDLTNLTNITGMFRGCSNFNQDVSRLNISNVTSLNGVFEFCDSFNQDVSSWDVSDITSMNSTFSGCVVFNQDISSWDVSNVTDMHSLFSNCTVFNQDISGWDLGAVNSSGFMFFGCENFNQDISGWDVSSFTETEKMFGNTFVFNQNLSAWDISNVTNMGSMFNNSGISIDNYDAILNGWVLQDVQSDINFGAIGLKFCTGETARNELINNKGWRFNGDIKDCSVLHVNESDFLENTVSLYPNPVNNIVQIKTNDFIEIKKVEVYNTLGKLVLKSAKNNMNLSNLNLGVYFVRISTERGTITKKIIKN